MDITVVNARDRVPVHEDRTRRDDHGTGHEVGAARVEARALDPRQLDAGNQR
jgi:hypothetical protein